MKKELKQAIINFIFENENEFQLHNAVTQKFRHYIYDPSGEYLIGGNEVSLFVDDAIKLLTSK
jgi:hypothetical protein